MLIQAGAGVLAPDDVGATVCIICVGVPRCGEVQDDWGGWCVSTMGRSFESVVHGSSGLGPFDHRVHGHPLVGSAEGQHPLPRRKANLPRKPSKGARVQAADGVPYTPSPTRGA